MTNTLDNIGTAMAPTWRARKRAPFTCYAVRAELVSQAAQMPEFEREAYLDERLTDLDRALSCDEAEALEKWLICEEMLQGRPASLGDGGGGGSGRSVLPDDVMEALEDHAEIKRRLSRFDLQVLTWLGAMMGAPCWVLMPDFIADVRHAASELTKIAHVHAQQIAHPLTKHRKSSP